jgi:hypothetical protein
MIKASDLSVSDFGSETGVDPAVSILSETENNSFSEPRKVQAWHAGQRRGKAVGSTYADA